MARVFFMLAGLACAISASLVVLPLLVFYDPSPGSFDASSFVFALIDLVDEGADIEPGEALNVLIGFLWRAALMICAFPVALSALIGELAGWRSVVWYCGATAFIAAGVPWLVRAALHLERAGSTDRVELHLALLFFLTGAAAGFIYWLISGHGAGPARNRAAPQNI